MRHPCCTDDASLIIGHVKCRRHTALIQLLIGLLAYPHPELQIPSSTTLCGYVQCGMHECTRSAFDAARDRCTAPCNKQFCCLDSGSLHMHSAARIGCLLSGCKMSRKAGHMPLVLMHKGSVYAMLCMTCQWWTRYGSDACIGTRW